MIARGFLLAVLAATTTVPGSAQSFRLATTTSVRDAGLLNEILPPFERRTGFTVRVIAVGSGQAMELGRRGEADILILHSPRAEREFVAQGYGVRRTPLMENQFVLAGPASDPARVRGLSVADAFRRIAGRGSRFVSRGDRSGTHAREMRIWELADTVPEGDWYLESGQGMGSTLQIASELRAYVLSDIGTYLAHPSREFLDTLVTGDDLLRNPYHVILLNPEIFPRARYSEAEALLEYLISSPVQRQIGEFRRAEFGRSLFRPAIGTN